MGLINALPSSSPPLILDHCILHGYGSLGARIVTGVKARASEIPLRIIAIVDRDPVRLAAASALHPEIPRYMDLASAISELSGPRVFIKDCTSPVGRTLLLDQAREARLPVLLEKPLSAPGVEVSLAGRGREASVSMSEAFNPAIRELAARLRDDAVRVNSLAFARVNSLTLERLRDASARGDVIGGAFVDKMNHDVHLLMSGALLGGAEVGFGPPMVREIAYDVRAGDGKSRLGFTSLDGRSLSPCQAGGLKSEPAEMMVDLDMEISVDGRSIPTRWIASWCGVPDDLAERLGVSAEHVERARMDNPGDIMIAGHAAYPCSNLKLIVCDYTDAAGEDVQLICNIQGRGKVPAWMVERRQGKERGREVQYCVSVVESMNSFSQRFCTGGYLSLERILKSDRAALDIRAQFRPALTEELRIERSLAILDRYNQIASIKS